MKNTIESVKMLALHNQIKEKKEKIAELEKEIVQEKIVKVQNLPSYFNVTSMGEVIDILKENSVIGSKVPKTLVEYQSCQGKKIPERIRNKVKIMVDVGRFTGKEIAERLNISLPSVQNIKKQFGLVKTYAE